MGGPVKLNGTHAFKDLQDPDELRLDYPTTILPPKKYLLPKKEALMRFDYSQQSILQEPEIDPPTVLLGVHTCDLHGIHLLDMVFTKGHIDPNYVKRRKQTIIISLECLNVCDEHSFCKSMGTLSASEGYDVHLTDLGDAYAVDVNTPTGEALLALLESRLDNIVHRLGFAASRAQARQLIRHGHVIVNGRKVDIPSYRIRPGDAIGVKPRPKVLELVQANLAEHQREVPEFLSLVPGAQPEGHVLRAPGVEDASLPVQVQLILELCSK